MTSKDLYEYVERINRRILKREWPPMLPRVIPTRDKGPVFADSGYDESGYWIRTNAKIKRVEFYPGCTMCSFYIDMCNWEVWPEFEK